FYDARPVIELILSK
nr:Chain G, Pertussis toxin-like subunit ArtA [Salmonella enterica subsp. enterica serovar Typhi str. CT18]